MERTDEELLATARAGDRDALEAVLSTWFGPLIVLELW